MTYDQWKTDSGYAEKTPEQENEGRDFPPTSCNAWEDCNHDGVCHDPNGCGGIGPNSRPRRCDTNIVGGMGECLACDADQGERCRAALKDATRGRGE